MRILFSTNQNFETNVMRSLVAHMSINSFLMCVQVENKWTSE
jgi:hypothetical protein